MTPDIFYSDKINIQLDLARNQANISLFYEADIGAIIKRIPGKKWIAEKKPWPIPLQDHLEVTLSKLFKRYGICVFKENLVEKAIMGATAQQDSTMHLKVPSTNFCSSLVRNKEPSTNFCS